MRPPNLIVLDADVFRQIVDARAVPHVLTLKRQLGIRLAVVQEVEEVEICSPRHRGTPYGAALEKGLSSGNILRLDAQAVRDWYREEGVQTGVADLAYERMLDLGERLALHIGLGEAYTFAIACGLSMPAASHDREAIDICLRMGLPLPSPVLRFFDLLVLLYQEGFISEEECDKIRKRLQGRKEFVPRSFIDVPFSVGLASFDPRILNADKPTLGLALDDPPPYQRPILYRQAG